MRIRTVKPEYWAHRMHRRLSEPAALMALALLNYADDEGRFVADAEAIKAQLFTYRTPTKSIEGCLEELKNNRWLALYQAEIDHETLRIGQIVTFKRHQVISRATKSALPPPPPGTLREDSVSPPKPVQEDSTGNRGTMDQEGRDGAATNEPKRNSWIPTFEEALAYCRKMGMDSSGTLSSITRNMH